MLKWSKDIANTEYFYKLYFTNASHTVLPQKYSIISTALCCLQTTQKTLSQFSITDDSLVYCEIHTNKIHKNVYFRINR